MCPCLLSQLELGSRLSLKSLAHFLHFRAALRFSIFHTIAPASRRSSPVCLHSYKVPRSQLFRIHCLGDQGQYWVWFVSRLSSARDWPACRLRNSTSSHHLLRGRHRRHRHSQHQRNAPNQSPKSHLFLSATLGCQYDDVQC